MKITKQRLKQIIKEEIEAVTEATIVNPLPKSRGKLRLSPIGGGGYRSPTKLPSTKGRMDLSAMSAGDPDGPADDAAELRDAADQLEGGSKHVFVVSKPGDPIWGIFSSEAKVKEFLEDEGEAPDYPYTKYILDPLVGP